jgi:uncharacterized protein with NRDE domain
MCLIVFAWRMRADLPLVVAANRDEWRKRPTARLRWWNTEPVVGDDVQQAEILRKSHAGSPEHGILAGQDLQDGGTWMGVTAAGRFAALTNVRDPARNQPGAPSRGALVRRFLESTQPASEYSQGVHGDGARYNGFNLLAGDGESLWWTSNHSAGPQALAPGIYGLSNSLLDTPWPKVVRARARLEQALAFSKLEPTLDINTLWALLADDAQAPDEALPDTGVGLEWERRLSAPFIHGAEYGTRSSAVILQDALGNFSFYERIASRGAT